MMMTTTTIKQINKSIHSESFLSSCWSLRQETFRLTLRFITVLIAARHWSLSWTRWIQSTPSQPSSLTPTLIWPFHLHLGLSSGLFPSRFPNKILFASLVCHTCYTPHPSHAPLRIFVKCTSYEGPHRALLSSLLPLPCLWPNILWSEYDQKSAEELLNLM
jgi:hypothetical protein